VRTRWLVAVGLLLPAVWIPALLAGGRDAPRIVEPSPEEVASEPESPVPGTPVFAETLGVPLHLPAASVRLVAFHEASMEGAIAMLPFGTCRPCRHPRFRPPPAGGVDLRYAVMDPRGRGTPPISAVDVVLDGDARVLSPVSGRVRVVRSYRLYGRYADTRVAIVPEGAPGLEVVLLHLRSGRLAPGDRVVAGVTSLGWARPFPFRSQVDRYARGGHPHVHVEVVDAQARDEAKDRRGAGG